MTYRNKKLLKESQRGHIARIKRLIEEGADVNYQGQYGNTPLIEAASLGHLDAVIYLLDAGADPTILTEDNAPTPFYAVVRGYPEVVKVLLEAGANPNANRDSLPVEEGDTPGVSMLHIAIKKQHMQIIESLLESGAYTDFIDFGKDAQMVAHETGVTSIINMLNAHANKKGGRRRSINKQ